MICASFSAGVVYIYELGTIIMRQLKIWLIEKSNVQTYVIVIILVLTIARTYIIDEHVRQTKDFYTPIVYFLLMLWVYYSVFYRVILDNDVNEKVILKRRLDEPKDLIGKFVKLSLLIFFSYRTFFIFARGGVIISLALITLTGLFCIYLIGKNTWNEKSSHKDFTQTLGQFAIAAGIVGYIYFVSWKSSFCYEFGIMEIGNYFEKDTYNAKYLVNICRTHSNGNADVNERLIDDDKENDKEAVDEIIENVKSEMEYEKKHTYKLPADIVVSDDFSEYQDYDTETGIGAYSYETTATSETRKVKILKVYFNNGGYLYFSDCFVPINNSDDCNCVDQDDKEWKVELTKVKIK
jgi:hypothetical protein